MKKLIVITGCSLLVIVGLVCWLAVQSVKRTATVKSNSVKDRPKTGNFPGTSAGREIFIPGTQTDSSRWVDSVFYFGYEQKHPNRPIKEYLSLLPLVSNVYKYHLQIDKLVLDSLGMSYTLKNDNLIYDTTLRLLKMSTGGVLPKINAYDSTVKSWGDDKNQNNKQHLDSVQEKEILNKRPKHVTIAGGNNWDDTVITSEIKTAKTLQLPLGIRKINPRK